MYTGRSSQRWKALGQEIGTAVRTLAQQDPNIANELVRSYLGTAFEQQSRPNVAGEPYSAGTKFWKTIAGGQGSEDREALQQMMTALPNGDALWQGFNELGTIFEAQGKRQAPGLKTAFNVEAIEKLKSGPASDAALRIAGTDITALGQWAKDIVERFRMGHNMEEVSRILTHRDAGPEFARIMAETSPNSPERLARMMTAISVLGTAQAARPAVESPEAQQPLTFSVSPGGQ